ncbi:MAG: TIGR02147 family protein [Myxococcota bacterium]
MLDPCARWRDRLDCEEVVGRSAPLAEVLGEAAAAAQCDLPVLILGPTGTGKTQLAAVIHQSSARGRRPFVAVGCPTFPDSLFEAHLFGAERGAFTGAVQAIEGFVPRAAGGTLFLDEVGELPGPVQSKLLVLVQTGAWAPLGSTRTRTSDLRVIAATNVAPDRLRSDLFHRLGGFVLRMPSLAERLEDLPLLAAAVCAGYAATARGGCCRCPTPRWRRSSPTTGRGTCARLENVLRRGMERGWAAGATALAPAHLTLSGPPPAPSAALRAQVRAYRGWLIERALIRAEGASPMPRIRSAFRSPSSTPTGSGRCGGGQVEVGCAVHVIYETTDYRRFLAQALRLLGLQQQDLARALGLGKATVSYILSGERDLDPSLVDRVAALLGLDAEQTEYFAALVDLTSKSPRSRTQALAAVRAIQRHRAEAGYTEGLAQSGNAWYFVPMLELVRCEAFEPRAEWIAAALDPPIRPEEAEQAWTTAVSTGLVELSGDDARAPEIECWTPSDVQGEWAQDVAQFHRNGMALAAGCLERADASERQVSTTVFAVSEEQFDRIRARLRMVEQEIVAIASEAGSAPANRVYQLGLQLFPVSLYTDSVAHSMSTSSQGEPPDMEPEITE